MKLAKITTAILLIFIGCLFLNCGGTKKGERGEWIELKEEDGQTYKIKVDSSLFINYEDKTIIYVHTTFQNLSSLMTISFDNKIIQIDDQTIGAINGWAEPYTDIDLGEKRTGVFNIKGQGLAAQVAATETKQITFYYELKTKPDFVKNEINWGFLKNDGKKTDWRYKVKLIPTQSSNVNKGPWVENIVRSQSPSFKMLKASKENYLEKEMTLIGYAELANNFYYKYNNLGNKYYCISLYDKDSYVYVFFTKVGNEKLFEKLGKLKAAAMKVKSIIRKDKYEKGNSDVQFEGISWEILE